jgi:hypothetical protein
MDLHKKETKAKLQAIDVNCFISILGHTRWTEIEIKLLDNLEFEICLQS